MFGLLGGCGIPVVRAGVDENLIMGIGHDVESCEFLRVLLRGSHDLDVG
jgi:hypothetical protein